ncbi:MAG: hypothetical protein ACE141_06480 [Bryobacteraceae bacterium]
MAQVANLTTSKMAAWLGSPTGLSSSLAAIAGRERLALSDINPQRVLAQSVAPELAERTAGVQYPAIYVYCEKLTNELREKFRTFSGKARLVVETRVTHDRLEELGRRLEWYVEAVTNVLDAHRGDWGNGVFYAGGYEVSFGACKHGGKNFLQTAKVTFEVDVSIG